MLSSSDYKVTPVGTKHLIGILKGGLFEDDRRTKEYLDREARRCGLLIPNADLAAVLLRTVSCKEMKLMGLGGLVAMSKPVYDKLLLAGSISCKPLLNAYTTKGVLLSNYGYAYVIGCLSH
jgi:hypothetical protein